MEKEFIESNIVILGKFDASAFDKLFFIKNSLINEDGFSDQSVFTPNFCRIISDELSINISPDQAVIVTRINSNDRLSMIAKAILKHSQLEVVAMGCNFKWFIFMNNLNSYTREQFYPTNNEILNKIFEEEDCAYGFYGSKKFGSSRMKLDIKPLSITDIQKNEQKKALSFDFNFHIDAVDVNQNFVDVLNNYNEFNTEVDTILQSYE